ncbi:hypothetical protein AaE_001991, partial [Aphanomyces astaci]
MLVPHLAPLNAFCFIALSAPALAAEVAGLVAVVAFAVDRLIERVVRSVGVFATDRIVANLVVSRLSRV